MPFYFSGSLRQSKHSGCSAQGETEMEWIYLTLVNGRLINDEGKDENPLWPTFKTEAEAEAWLVANDIRASIR